MQHSLSPPKQRGIYSESLYNKKNRQLLEVLAFRGRQLFESHDNCLVLERGAFSPPFQPHNYLGQCRPEFFVVQYREIRYGFSINEAVCCQIHTNIHVRIIYLIDNNMHYLKRGSQLDAKLAPISSFQRQGSPRAQTIKLPNHPQVKTA